MEKYTHFQIITALNVIKDVCKNEACVECPFYGGKGACKITENSPQHWEINNIEYWRAFK